MRTMMILHLTSAGSVHVRYIRGIRLPFWTVTINTCAYSTVTNFILTQCESIRYEAGPVSLFPVSYDLITRNSAELFG